MSNDLTTQTARIVDRISRISGIVIASLRVATDANSLSTCTLTTPCVISGDSKTAVICRFDARYLVGIALRIALLRPGTTVMLKAAVRSILNRDVTRERFND